MNPVVVLERMYDERETPRTFAVDLYCHLTHGYVISTPQMFFMARPVCSWADHEEINDPFIKFDAERCDTWYIYAMATGERMSAAGLVKKTIAHMPYFLPYCAWERVRDKKLRFFRTEKFLQSL